MFEPIFAQILKTLSMLDILLTASVSFIITFLAIPVVIQIAEQKKLYDIPDERKVHTRLVASLGGIGIFAGFLLASLLQTFFLLLWQATPGQIFFKII